MENKKNRNTTIITIIGLVLVSIIIIFGIVFTGYQSRKDTEEAVRSVSMLYLDELAGRREQVVENNLNSKIDDIQVALDLMSDDDLKDENTLRAYQAHIKKIYDLEKFAFVDENGIIYTSNGTQDNIDEYKFDYDNLTSPDISILSLETKNKKVVIAIPVDKTFNTTKFKVCFMEIDMENMLQGVSMKANKDAATFCNIYTKDGIALTDTILGGLAVEDNLLEALKTATYEQNNSYDKIVSDFENKRSGVVSFTYNGIKETLSYVPVGGTDWFLTYLIRESVLSDKFKSAADNIIYRSIAQIIISSIVLLIMTSLIIMQTKKNSRLLVKTQQKETENRIKQEEMEQRLALQEKLLEEQKNRQELDNMITAMAADYRSVYHVDLDNDEAICYRADINDTNQHKEGIRFPYYENFKYYADNFVNENYREGFIDFINPDNIKSRLLDEKILAYRYLANRDGKEYYEMIRVAGVRTQDERTDNMIHAVGLGLTIIDKEMRDSMAQNEALSDALEVARQASVAKTVFFSNMSHELRTPMNAIVGLDAIALNDKDTPEKTKEYLRQIGTSAEHLLNLINDILDVSRIESGKMTIRNEEFSFAKLLESVNTMFSSQCQEKNLEYSCKIINDVDDNYIGDSTKLRQILVNILGNAVKFTEKGHVKLIVEKINNYKDKTTLSFTIEDTGIGISEEFLPHLFETFAQEDSSYTNKYGSTGLGMAITKNIIDLMNGNINVTSTKGKGTTFVVTITLSNASKKQIENDDENIQLNNMSILVVDDDTIAGEHASLVLEKIGMSVDVALSGKDAISLVSLRHARQKPYNLIIIDWKMPEMDGIETTKNIRNIIGHESAIIILTAYKFDEIQETAVQAGVDSFISKPLFANNVIDEFKIALRKKKEDIKENKIDLSGKHILLAEDVKINATIIQMMLETKNIVVDYAANGKEAVEKYKNNENKYDAILMDIRMPEMDGLEATKIIRSLDKDDAKTIPIIALTANAFDEDVQKSLQAGLNAHLTKPIQPDDLFKTLESFINRK